jgi:hypothetical protein
MACALGEPYGFQPGRLAGPSRRCSVIVPAGPSEGLTAELQRRDVSHGHLLSSFLATRFFLVTPG